MDIRNLTVHYTNTNTLAIDDISLSIAQGDRVAILGPSGCGKSTLLRAIMGLGQNMKVGGAIDFGEISAKDIAMVFQEATLLPWKNAQENVAFGMHARGFSQQQQIRQIDAVFSMVQLSGYKTYYPQHLSIGMQQRVNVARALAVKPKLLLLDEPFSALDFETKRALQQDILGIVAKENITLIFVTHILEEALALANTIVVLTSGPARVKHILQNGVNLQQNVADDLFE